MADDKKSAEQEGKSKALGLALDTIEKQFGKGSIMKMGDAHKVKVECIPTGSISLDLALGGGIPKGPLLRFTGPKALERRR
jgi:recombination protein RecA